MTVPRVEPLNLLDERFVGSRLAAESYVLSATMKVEGGPLRRPDGSVDLEAIHEVHRRFIAVEPRYRQVLRRAPLGLMCAAWVPAEAVDLDWHVKLHSEVVSATRPDPDVVRGGSLPPMDLARPLWETHVYEADDGDLFVLLRVHHAVGDGIFGLSIIDRMTAEQPDGRPSAEEGMRPRPPRTAVGLYAGAFRSWYRAQGSFPAAWADYWRKPMVMRLRRTGGRLLRPIKDREVERRGLRAVLVPPRRSGLAEVDAGLARRAAKALGAGLNDLVTVLTARALLAAEPGREEIALVVPIADRNRGDRSAGNQIRVARVVVRADASIADQVAAVKAEVRRVVESGEAIVPREASDGYSTFLPSFVRPRYLGAGRVRSLAFWPAPNRQERVGVLALSYTTTLSIAVVSEEGLDAQALADDLTAALEENLSSALAQAEAVA